MWKQIAKLIRYITTARDNETPSLIRITALVFAFADASMGFQFLILAGTVQGFDSTGYGAGVGAILAGQATFLAALGAALKWSLGANAGNDMPPTSDPQ